MSNPVASVEIQAKSTGLAAQLRSIRSKFGTFADGVATKAQGAASKFRTALFGKAGKDGKGGGGAFQHAVGNLASGAITKVGSFLTDAGQSAFQFQERIERLKIAAGETPEVMAAWAKQMKVASDATGLNKADVLGAAEAYVRLTGDVKTAREQTFTFAKVAQATGSMSSEIAETAAAMGQNMKVPAAQFEEMFSALSIQGKAGAIELKDLAAEMSTIAPQWAQFNKGIGAQGVRELGAAMQIVKKGFGGDAGETTVGLSNFLTAIQKKGARFRDSGVEKFFTIGKDKKERMDDVFTIIDKISKSKLANSKEGLLKAFGSIEAYRAYIQLRDNRAELTALVEKSKDGASIQRDFDTYMASSAGRTAKAWNNVKNTIAEVFTADRIEKFANTLEAAANHAGTVAKGLGLIGDAISGLVGIGKGVRGIFSKGNSNPFGFEDRIEKQELAIARAKGNKKTEAEILDKQSARAGYNRTVDRILGGEKNERSTPESLKRAVFARFSENRGDSTAGNRYLANAFGSGQEVSDQVDKVSREVFATLGKELGAQLGLGGGDDMRKLLAELAKIAANTAAGTEVKVGGDAVAKASKTAPTHRAKVAK